MKNKIAIIVCAWPPQGGGMGNNAYYHAKKLSVLDYETTVFTPLDFKISRSQVNHRENLTGFLPGVEKLDTDSSFVLSPEKSWFKFGHAGFLFSLFKKLKNFDLIHLYYPFFGTDLVIWFFKKMNPKIKLVLHYQMDPVGCGWQKWFFLIYFKLFFGLIVRASDKIIILSYDHAENSYLKKYLKIYPEKFTVVPNGVETNIFYPRSKNTELMAKYDLTVDNLVVVFVGGLDKQHYFKGVDILLSAFKLLTGNKKRLLVIGDGNLRGHYQKMAKILNITSQVIFVGWVKNENLPDYYGLADVFVLPSTARTESFGIVTAEAQACGLPALVSDWPGSRQTIEDGQTGFLIKPDDVIDLKEKMEKLFNDENLRKKMGEKGAERAGAMYGWGGVVREIDKLYQEILNS